VAAGGGSAHGTPIFKRHFYQNRSNKARVLEKIGIEPDFDHVGHGVRSFCVAACARAGTAATPAYRERLVL
jgi:hypothetical protein